MHRAEIADVKELTDNEKCYLRVAYVNGYRYVAKDFNGIVYFYKNEPTKVGSQWMVKITKLHDIFESMIDFGVSYEDEKPTKIYDLLGINNTDWSKVKPFTPVFVRDSENEDWVRAFFLEYTDDERERFNATYYSKWTDDGSFDTWRYCRLATQEEVDEVIGGN